MTGRKNSTSVKKNDKYTERNAQFFQRQKNASEYKKLKCVTMATNLLNGATISVQGYLQVYIGFLFKSLFGLCFEIAEFWF